MRVNIVINGIGYFPYNGEVVELKIKLSDGYPLSLKPVRGLGQEVFRSSGGFSILTTVPILLSPYEEEHLDGAVLDEITLADNAGTFSLDDIRSVICSVSLIDLDLKVGTNVRTLRSYPPLGAREFQPCEIKLCDPYIEKGCIEFDTKINMPDVEIAKKFGVVADDYADYYVSAYVTYAPKTGNIRMNGYIRNCDSETDFELELTDKEKELFRQSCENFPYPDGITALEFISN